MANRKKNSLLHNLSKPLICLLVENKLAYVTGNPTICGVLPKLSILRPSRGCIGKMVRLYMSPKFPTSKMTSRNICLNLFISNTEQKGTFQMRKKEPIDFQTIQHGFTHLSPNRFTTGISVAPAVVISFSSA